MLLPSLVHAVEDCYASGIRSFYAGNRGQLDRFAAVKQEKQKHRDIRLFLVLTCHPAEQSVNLADLILCFFAWSYPDSLRM